MFDIIKWILITCAIVVILYALIKYDNARPILIVLLCIGWLGLGTYSGVTLYKYTNTQNQVIGEPTIHDPYENFNFYEYNLSNIVWYQTEDGYQYEEEYKTTNIDFDGTTNTYELLVNNTPCNKTTSTSARLHGEFIKQFRDFDGNIADIISFNIDFTFSKSSIILNISNNATPDNIGLVTEYIDVEGFNLRIINSVYVSA